MPSQLWEQDNFARKYVYEKNQQNVQILKYLLRFLKGGASVPFIPYPTHLISACRSTQNKSECKMERIIKIGPHLPK